MGPKITRKIQIGELVMNYPEAVEVLFEYGFHCVGCGLSAYETLEQGAAAHGYDDAAIDRMVEDIKNAVKKSSAKNNGMRIDLMEVTVSDSKKPARKANKVASKKK